MKINEAIMLGALAFSMAGCLSVEGMRAKLNSGDPKVVAEAEQTIIHKAASWNNKSATSKEVIIECLALVENNQALYGLIDSGYGYFLNDAAKSIKIRNENDAEQTIRKCIEWADEKKNLNENALAKRAIAKIQSPSILHTLYGEANMLAYPKGADLAREMANRLCEIETDQLALVNLIGQSSSADSKYKEQAFAKITELPAKLKLIEEYQYQERIINSLSEKELADYLIGAVDDETYEKEKKEALSKISSTPIKGDTKDSKMKAVAAEKSVQVNCYKLPYSFDSSKVFARINDQKLLGRIVLKAKLNHVKQSAAEKITDKKIKLVLVKKFVKDWIKEEKVDGDYLVPTVQLLMTLATEQDGLFELVSNLDKGKNFYSHKKLVERITDPKTADLMFEKMPLPIYRDDRVFVMETLFEKLSKEKKDGLAKAALERSKGVTDKIKFGEFWVGMPLVDFYALREHCGIDADYRYYENKDKEGAWYNKLTATELLFPLKACQKYLDCEDSKILYQTIHKYVMHKEGKANVLDYMGLTKLETEDASTRSFNIWTGTTSTNYDFKNWKTYSNSKHGTKIWFNAKKGILRFTGL